MTFLELCNRVCDESGISDSGLNSVTGQTGILGLIVSWVRQANKDVQNMHPDWAFKWDTAKSTTTPNRSDYTPSDLSMVDAEGLRVRNIDRLIVGGAVVPVIPWQVYKSRVEPNPSEVVPPSTPTVATVTPKGLVRMHPAPREPLPVIVDYFKTFADLVGNTDESIIPPQHQEVIVDKALMYYGREENDQASYNNAAMAFEEHLTQLMADELPELTVYRGAYHG